MSSISNKQRLIRLHRYLMKQTDEDHQATMSELIEYLRKEDAGATRKTVKDDIEILTQEGIDIVVTRSYFNSYFVGCRDFEMPEVTLLAESIASNESLTHGQKTKLIRKLYTLLSKYQAEKVARCIGPLDDRESGNEKLYYIIDRITEAVDAGRRIAFRFSRDAGSFPNKSGRDTDKEYSMTPIGVMCNDNRCYLFGYDAESDKYKVVRADYMHAVRVLEDKADKLPPRYSSEDYTESFFPPEEGTFREVVLECDNETMPLVIDKFGDDAEMWKSTRKSFYVKKVICVTSSFYAWLFSCGGKIRVVSPGSVQETYRELLRRSLA